MVWMYNMIENFGDYFSDITVDLSEFNKENNIGFANVQPVIFNLKNVFAIYKLQDLLLNDMSDITEDYYIKDDMTPEQISKELYSDYNFWWVNLLINKISIIDFPINEESLIALSKKLNITEKQFSSSKIYYDLLREANDKRRTIKVIKSKYLLLFLRQLYDFMRGKYAN